jgi:hypothetical protein
MMETLIIEDFKTFRHFKLDFKDLPNLVIFDPKDFWKDELLSALMLFFRGLQTKDNSLQYIGPEQPELENRLPLYCCGSKFTATFSGHPDVTVKCGNGYLSLQYSPTMPRPTICYAFMGMEYRFQPPTTETERCGTDIDRNASIMTSYDGNIRTRYFLLTNESKTFIIQSLHSIFGIINIVDNPETNSIYMVYSPTYQVEVLYVGLPSQKVFCTLILLCSLSQQRYKQQMNVSEDQPVTGIFLCEEPEIFMQRSKMYPPQIQQFVSIIQSYAAEHSLFFICSTNDHETVNLFTNQEARVYLSDAIAQRPPLFNLEEHN